MIYWCQYYPSYLLCGRITPAKYMTHSFSSLYEEENKICDLIYLMWLTPSTKFSFASKKSNINWLLYIYVYHFTHEKVLQYNFCYYLRQGGYVFTWVCLWVCEFVCEQDNSKTWTDFDEIFRICLKI